MVLNFLSTLIATFASQIICYPALASIMDSASYGSVLVGMGVVNALGTAFGAALDNTRLLTWRSIAKPGGTGGYNRLAVIYTVLCFIIVFFVCRVPLMQETNQSVALGVVACIIELKTYLTVEYRIRIDYKKILLINIVSAFAYIVGVLLLGLYDWWPIVFIAGEGAALLYALCSTSFLKEGIAKDSQYKNIVRTSTDLFLASLSSNVSAYLDRFLISAILGPQSVSLYTVASLMGKMLSMAATPIANVLLSHYAANNSATTRAEVVKRFVTLAIVFLLCFLTVIVIAPFVLSVLYPSLFEESLRYCSMASLAAILYILGNLMQPTMLVICDSKYQPLIQIIYLISYMVLGLIMSMRFGLMGFCAAATIAALLRIVFTFGLSYYFAEKNILEQDDLS